MCFQVYPGYSHECTEIAYSERWRHILVLNYTAGTRAYGSECRNRANPAIIWQRCSMTTFEETLLREVATLPDLRQADVLASAAS